MQTLPTAKLFSRLAIAFSFLAFGIWEVIAPNLWTVYVPAYAIALFPAEPLVFIHGIALVVIALGLLWGRYARIFTGLATLMMLQIVFELLLADGFTETFIRDVTILIVAIGLLIDALKTSKR